MIAENLDYISVNLIPEMTVKMRKGGENKGKWYYRITKDRITSEYFDDHITALNAASQIADIREEV